MHFAGVLDDVKVAFNISKGQQGLLQTVFVISYMIFAPIFGYLGDRYSRKILMSFGVLLWSVTTLAGSFMVLFRSQLKYCLKFSMIAFFVVISELILLIFVSNNRRSSLLGLSRSGLWWGSGKPVIQL